MTERRLAMVASRQRQSAATSAELLTNTASGRQPTEPQALTADRTTAWVLTVTLMMIAAWVLMAVISPLNAEETVLPSDTDAVESGANDQLESAPAAAEDRSKLREPVYRVSKVPAETGDYIKPRTALQVEREKVDPDSVRAAVKDRIAASTSDAPLSARDVPKAHPLDHCLEMARESLAHIERDIRDYTCTMVKRERVNGELTEHEFMTCKIRHTTSAGGTPFSVYLGFRKPDAVRGREVIYIEGAHDGKLVAHEGGLRGRFIPTVHLAPSSALAMRGNRYPITEIGIKTLTRRLIEKGERDRKVGDCQVRMVDGAKIDGRVCTMLEVKHVEQNEVFDFHLARIFMDKELNVPIRYESYGWPVAGGKPPLLEEYTYMNLKLNVGLAASEFDIANPNYRF